MRTDAVPEPRPRGRPRLRTLDATRTLILDAAERTFLSRGVGGAGIDTIARAAGVSKRTLYELFATKEAMLAALISRRRDDLHWLADAEPEADMQAVEATLRRFLRAFARLVLSSTYVSLYRLITTEAGSYPGLARTFYREGPERTIAALGSWLERQHARGFLAVGDARQTAGMLAAMTIAEPLRLIAFNLAEPLSPAEAEAYADQALHLFLNGCRPAPSPDRHAFPGR